MQDYKVNYESEEENDIDDVAYFIKKLLVDTPQNLLTDVDTTNKLFITKLDSLQNIKSINTINILANTVFKHQITFTDTTIPLSNLMPYSLIYELICNITTRGSKAY